LQISLIKSAIFLNSSEKEFSKLDIENQKNQLNYIGNNLKKVLIISNHSISETNSNEHQLLINMLKAIKLNIDDVVIIEKSKNLNFKYLIRCFEIDTCLFFGIIPKDVHLNIVGHYYRVIPFHNRKILFAEDLKSISDKKDSKEAIWKNLKKLFPEK